MRVKDDGGPAFPGSIAVSAVGGVHEGAQGMALRDWFAGQALAGMLANGFRPDEAMKRNGPGARLDWGHDTYANAAFRMADHMLAARTGEKE